MKKYSNYKSNYDKYPIRSYRYRKHLKMFVGKVGRKLYRS